MSDSAFRNRGLGIVVDTTQQAEWDMDGLQIPDAQRELVAKSLRLMPISPRDRYVEGVRVREFDGYEWMFILTREGAQLVATIGGVELCDPDKPMEKLLEKISLIDMLRGAGGV